MTRKDYVMIAEVIKTQIEMSVKFGEEESQAGAENIARDLADALQADNDRFDRARFLTACGVN
jgi:hypothetical protein